jgi:RNA polymerase sigma factor (sigma-70 family)
LTLKKLPKSSFLPQKCRFSEKNTTSPNPTPIHFRLSIQRQNGTMPINEKNTDIELLQACQRDDPMAQQLLFRRYYGKVLGICMRYMGNREEANDVVNAVFLKIFRSSGQYSATGPVGGWIGKIALHTSIDFIRQRTAFRKHIASNEIPDAPVENEAIGRLTEEALLAMIQELPAACRAVFSLHVIEGFTHNEIAETLGISSGTSKWHLSHARGILQEKLKKSAYKTLVYNYV